MNIVHEIRHRKLGLATTMLSLLAIAAPLDTAMSAKAGVTTTSQAAHRPSGLYKVIFQSDGSICSSIGASLNKPLDLAIDENHPNLIGDLLLGSDLQVPWQRKLIGPIGNLDYADIDLANDGRMLAVYRYSILLHYVRSEDDLYVLPKPSEIWKELTHSDSLEQLKESEAVARLAKQSSINFYGSNNGPYQSISLLLSSKDFSLAQDHFVMNVLSVRGRSILIVTGADEAHYALKGRPFHVFGLLYHAKSAPSLVCEFRTQA